jgi:hypothetical protein
MLPVIRIVWHGNTNSWMRKDVVYIRIAWRHLGRWRIGLHIRRRRIMLHRWW